MHRGFLDKNTQSSAKCASTCANGCFLRSQTRDWCILHPGQSSEAWRKWLFDFGPVNRNFSEIGAISQIRTQNTNVMHLEPDSFFSLRAYLVYEQMDCSWAPRKPRLPCPPLCSPRSWPWRQIRSLLTRSTQLSGCDRPEAQRGTLKVKQKHHEEVQNRSAVFVNASH